MMKRPTLKYFSLISTAFLLFVAPCPAQEQNKEKKTAQTGAVSEESLFTFKGVFLSADLFGYVSRLFSDGITSEVAAEFNFRNQFFPTVELGYGSYDATGEYNGIHYRCAAPYFRAGLNYNFLYRKGKESNPNIGYVGFRYGFSTFDYDVEAPDLKDPVWGGEVPFEYNDVSGNYHWFELCGGIKAKIWKNFYMGWCIRYKVRLDVKNAPHSRPWYIPGFGDSTHTTFGGTYSLIFNLPIKK